MPVTVTADPLTPSLQQMKGIDLPQPLPIWPLAPGWWVLLLVITLALLLLARRRYRKLVLRRAARATLKQLCRRYRQDRDQRRLVKGLSLLLRRLALARYPRRAVAGLQGREWLAFLDLTGGGDGFQTGPGRILTSYPYGANDKVNTLALITLTSRWIRSNT